MANKVQVLENFKSYWTKKQYFKGDILDVIFDKELNDIDRVVVDNEYEYICDVGSNFYTKFFEEISEEGYKWHHIKLD